MRWNNLLLGKITFLLVLPTLLTFSCRKAPISGGRDVTHQKEVVSSTGLISPDDKAVTVTGAFFAEKKGDKIVLNRFTDEILKNDSTFFRPANAATQTGVCISIATNSPEITFRFEKRDDAAHRHSSFGIMKNDLLFKEVKISPDDPFDGITITNPDGRTFTDWAVILPPYYGVHFTGIETEPGSKYAKTATGHEKTVYVAIGNSITHGTGQSAGYQTYPFILAEKKGWTLYNLAVGGSKTSWPVATLLNGKKVDVITILWGYNDWNAGFTVEQEQKYYGRLVEELLKAQPSAKIYCITPTFTNATHPKRGSLSLDDIRAAQARVAESFRARGHENLTIIHGEDITDRGNLKPTGSKDKVHFTIEGAAKFAERLAEIIR